MASLKEFTDFMEGHSYGSNTSLEKVLEDFYASTHPLPSSTCTVDVSGGPFYGLKIECSYEDVIALLS